MKFLIALALAFSFSAFADDEAPAAETVEVTEERDLCAEMDALNALMEENAVVCEAPAANEAEAVTTDEG